MKELNQNSASAESGMETRLWDYIDGNSREVNAIEKLIADNTQWRKKYNELMEVHQLIITLELEQPSLRFTKNVMDKIAKLDIAPAAKKYIDKKIIWSIAIFFISIICGFIIYAVAQIDWSAATSDTVIGIDLTKLDYSKIFSNSFVNIFMMMNVVLGLMLLDRYLSNKKTQMQTR